MLFVICDHSYNYSSMVSGSLDHVGLRQNFSLLCCADQTTQTYLMAEPSQRAVLPATLQSEDLQSRWDDHLLLLVIGRRNSLESLETLQSILSSLGLVRNHSSDGSPEDLGGSPEVEGATAGLHVATLLEEVEILQLVAVEVPWDGNS